MPSFGVEPVRWRHIGVRHIPMSIVITTSKALVSTSFSLLLVRHLLLVAMHLFLVKGSLVC